MVADTEVAQVNQMENHLERKEVKDALATGYGYSVRRSGTLGMQMALRGDPFIGRQIHTAPFCLFNRFG